MKRIVILEPDGMMRIIGTCDGELPEVIAKEGEQSYGLIQVKPRYAVYKQILVAASGRFNEFHPSQE